MLMEKERKDIVSYGRLLIEKELTEGRSGNLSIYDIEHGLMAISPSGVAYEEMRPEDVVIMDLEGSVVDGDLKPSSEHSLHSVVYRVREDVKAVIHAHSCYCTTLACMHIPLLPVHYALAENGCTSVPLVRYETFGTEQLARAVEEKIPESRGLLLANHGMLACSESIEEAFSFALNMEWCAALQWRCMCAGEPVALSRLQMEKALKRFGTYGQVSDTKKGYF